MASRVHRLVRGKESRELPDEAQINVEPVLRRLLAAGWHFAEEEKHESPGRVWSAGYRAKDYTMRRRACSNGALRAAAACVQSQSYTGPTSLTADANKWAASANVLAGQPAFILGNGPTLPTDLRGLQDFFTVGVNRLLLRFDPTVLMWFDPEVADDLGTRLAKCGAIKFVAVEHAGEHGTNGLTPFGTTHCWVDAPLNRPDYVASSGNSGVSAAYWAMSLGCRPIFLVGMSADYSNGKTNFYGKNGAHNGHTCKQLRRALRKLLEYKGVYVIRSQGEVNKVAKCLRARAMGRQWYVAQFLARHAIAETFVLPKVQRIGDVVGLSRRKPESRMAHLQKLAYDRLP